MNFLKSEDEDNVSETWSFSWKNSWTFQGKHNTDYLTDVYYVYVGNKIK